MIHTLVYRDTRLTPEAPSFERLVELHAQSGVMLWIDLSEPTEEETRQVMASLLNLHPLTIEDCQQDNPLPKVERYDDYLYIVMHAVDYSKTEKFTTTEVDLILGKDFLLTYHRSPLKPVQVALERAHRAANIPVRGPDRLAHSLLDLLVDYYIPAMAELRGEVERIEESVLEHSKAKLEEPIIELREDLTALRQIIRPQRELVAELAQGRTAFVRKKMLPYLRDLHDEFVRIEERAKGWSDQTLLLFRVYLNRSSHEANDGIRVLTSLTAITLPLLIVGGWFGMNFRRMAGLDSHVAYWATMGVTVTITVGLFIFLRRRRWF